MIGMVYVAPMLYFNYCIMLPRLVPEAAKFATLKKVFIDQTVFASLMTSGFFVIINLLEGNSVSKAMGDIQQKLWTTMLINWQIWIPAQAVNFYFTPIKYQVLFGNCVSVLYNIALSFIHHSMAFENPEAAPSETP